MNRERQIPSSSLPAHSVIPAKAEIRKAARQARHPKPSANRSRQIPSHHSPHAVIPAKAGIQKAASQARHPKPSPNRGQRIPSPILPTPSFPRRRESRRRQAKPAIQNQAQIAVNGSLPPILPTPSFPRKRESRDQPSPSPKTKPKSRSTDPFPLYGGRLGWGCAARKRGFGGSEFSRKPTPCKPFHLKRAKTGAAAPQRNSAGERRPRSRRPHATPQTLPLYAAAGFSPSRCAAASRLHAPGPAP